jgi:hypothetical protein
VNQAIRDLYINKQGDSQALFGEVLRSGTPDAWRDLEQCVIEKRLAWFNANRSRLKFSGDPVWDGYNMFYYDYLGLSIPSDGVILIKSREQVLSRWWNRCPTLEACQASGLETRQVCQMVYERPVEILLQLLDARLHFERSYIHIRPHADYCEERVWLEPG